MFLARTRNINSTGNLLEGSDSRQVLPVVFYRQHLLLYQCAANQKSKPGTRLQGATYDTTKPSVVAQWCQRVPANTTGSIPATGTIGDSTYRYTGTTIADSSPAKRFHRHCTGNRHHSTGTILEIPLFNPHYTGKRPYSTGTIPTIGSIQRALQGDPHCTLGAGMGFARGRMDSSFAGRVATGPTSDGTVGSTNSLFE